MPYSKYTTFFLLLFLLWTACQKAELPPSSFDDPVFTVTHFGDDTISGHTITAGKDGLYLFTDFETNDFVTCTGSFSEVDCASGNCPGNLTFEFKSTATDSFVPAAIFHLGGYQFLGPDSGGSKVIYHATFNAITNLGYNNFSWKIDSQNAGIGPIIEVDFPDSSATPDIELSALKATGLQSKISRRISLNNPNGDEFLGLNIDISPDSFLNFRLTAETSGPPYEMLIWDTGDTAETIFRDSLSPSYSVISTDGFGNTAMASFNGITPNAVPLRTANFTYTVEQIIVPGAPGEVAIRWVDSQGVIWHSDKGSQNTDSFFVVEASEPYDQNENGQKTRKMSVNFNCQLFNDAGESRSFSGSGTIAVAHP